jgi:hypothetical protein
MRLKIAAAIALVIAWSANAQTIPDLSTATPIAGAWSYAPAADGSEAVFDNASGYPQLWVHCTRSTRRVSIARSANAAAPLLNVWTSSGTGSIASSFDPATGRLRIDLANWDPLLDAIATSRGRIGFSVGTEPALVVPAWAEVARVIEDCRA